MNEELEVIRPESLALRHELSVEEVVARVQKVHAIMRQAMIEGHHYGAIPGTGEKPTLLLAGMELLCMTFRLDPQYTTVTTRDDGGHLTVTSTCTLFHIPTGQRVGSGMGSCSTREAKYAYRQAARLCPKCGKDAIIKGREEYGGGWLCFKKKDGCGGKFAAEDTTITGQVVGRIANEDLADQENTVLKMANKRSLGSAVKGVTAASDIFTVDLEDTITPPAPVILSSEDLKAERTEAHRVERESVEHEAARLFQTPEEKELRAMLIAHIKRIAEEKKIPMKERQLLAQSVLAGASLDTADVSALQDLETAVIGWKAKA